MKTLTAAELDQLAQDINTLHEQITMTPQRAVLLGEKLIKVKASLKHGEWLPWLTAHCKVKQSMARKYMLLAKRYKNKSLSDNESAEATIDGLLGYKATSKAADHPAVHAYPDELSADRPATKDVLLAELRQWMHELDADEAETLHDHWHDLLDMMHQFLADKQEQRPMPSRSVEMKPKAFGSKHSKSNGHPAPIA